MVTRGLLEKFFQAASIQRWNDHIRPVELTELDKQAHKMVLAYLLGRFEETERGAKIDWSQLIEGGIIEFLQRVILTDIKAPIYHKMMAKRGREINAYVLKKLAPDLKAVGGGFQDRFERYLSDTDPEFARLEKRILKAAHYLATNWEFRIIYNICPFIYGIEKTKEEIENQIEDHYDLIGVQKISLNKKSFGFMDLCGQLRFQQRWAHSPRIPKTSVLGHMLIVAMMTYFYSREQDACPKRIYNNFFGGLFHDLPEVLTRDIIHPIKSDVEGLQETIKEYEQIQIEEQLLPLLPADWHAEIRYFVTDEFANRIMKRGQRVLLPAGTLDKKYNRDEFSPCDGRLIRICDEFAAFIEAALSIEHGIKSRPLVETYEKYKTMKISGATFGRLFS